MWHKSDLHLPDGKVHQFMMTGRENINILSGFDFVSVPYSLELNTVFQGCIP